MAAVLRLGEKTVYLVGGREVPWEEFARATRRALPCGVKPKKSDALAVHPKQVAEAVESAKHKGVPTEFLPDGRPVIRSRAHQKAYLKAYGFHNKDGGYGD